MRAHKVPTPIKWFFLFVVLYFGAHFLYWFAR